MSLLPGTSKEVLNQNISELIGSGKDPKQSIAMAYAERRKHQLAGGGIVQNQESATGEKLLEAAEGASTEVSAEPAPAPKAEMSAALNDEQKAAIINYKKNRVFKP